ncbi:MAG: efflux RND transporter permease subunit [Candidatus Latescibacteria bacterium]|nr:efflux RND transporter permease subunit [Candidatus Latescibacterota bacterium]
MKIIRFAVSHPVTIWMATIAAVVFGVVALGRLDMRLLPAIRYPSVTLQTEFPNTAPADVENLVTRPLEEAVGVVPGLRRVHSISQSGLSQITLEFGWGTDMDYASLDVREKVDLIQLPAEALPPVLLKYDPAQDPVLRIGLWGDAPLARLRAIADEVLKREIESLQGVAAAKVSGGLEEEIRVEVDEDRLSALGVPIAAVADALAQENVNASGGRLRDRNAEYVVRTLSRFASVDDIGEVSVGGAGGRAVKLRDVAAITRTHRERTTITHVDGRESVEIAVYKEGDDNIVDMAASVRRHLDKVSERLPEGMEVAVLFDQSVFIAKAVAEVRNNALLGGLLAVLVLYVFLRELRSTLIIGVAIPISIIATFILMYGRGVSLNVMSLGGLALGVGMLVDNSIVVLEAIHRRREADPGLSPAAAAARGAAEVSGAVVASTLTTVAVFVPIVFVVVGVAGQIFRDQALTVTFSLLVSLAVALTFTPMAVAFGRGGGGGAASAVAGGALPVAGSRLKTWTRYAGGGRPASRRLRTTLLAAVLFLPALLVAALVRLGGALRAALLWLLSPLIALFNATYPRLSSGYERLLGVALRRRGLVLGFALALAAGAAVLAPRLGVELIPPMAQGEFTLGLELPEGTPLSRTDARVAAIERGLAGIDGIVRTASDVGVSREGDTSASRRKENRAEIHVRLDRADQAREAEVLAGARRVLAGYPDVSMKVRRQSLFSFSAPVEVDVYGYNLEDLQRSADAVAASLAEVEGLRDVRLSMVPGSPEVRVAFDRDKLNRHGLSLGQVSQLVRDKVRGSVAGRIRERERHIDIRVMNGEEQRNTLQAVRDLIVAERDGVPIPLAAVASMSVEQGPSEIHRLGRKRAVIVSANLAGRDLGSVTRDVEGRLRALSLPAGVTVAMGGQNEEMRASFRSLWLAALLAVFLVYLVMAAQFESFLHPLIIMFTVPLALTGAVYGLALTGTPISVIAVIGAIMLAGIVVNNGIVLVDRINQLRRDHDLENAVRLAGRERLRPILMTTATTVLGLLPMALGLGEGAELRAPLAITVIWGLTLATLLTLVVVPAAYALITPGRTERERVAAAAAAGAVRTGAVLPVREGA